MKEYILVQKSNLEVLLNTPTPLIVEQYANNNPPVYMLILDAGTGPKPIDRTWNDTAPAVTITQAQLITCLWETVRYNRDELLRKCDWTQMPDSSLVEEQKTLWKIYRQRLRDITYIYTTPIDVIFPPVPEV